MDINSLSRRRTLVDSVVEQVRNNIESGLIKPNERLPTELELGDRFGVSRTVIREATRRLQALGLVEVRRGRGLFVGTHDSVRDTVQMLRSSLSVSLADLCQFNDFREAIETHAARQAALKATPGDVEKLQDLCDRLVAEVETGDDVDAIQKADIAFHLQIAAIAGNELLVQILQLVRDVMLKCMLRTTPGRGLKPKETRRLHQKIVDAIRSQDALRAEQAMRDHMEAVQRRLRKSVAGDQAAGER